MGALHANHISKSKYGKLHSVVDINTKRGSDIAGNYGVKFYRSTQEALLDPSLNAVSISTNTPYHADLIIESAKMGKAILCENPIDISVENTTKALQAVKKSRVAFLV